MIVPQFWAEARRHQPREKGKQQITVRRFGWSETSQAEAEHMAAQRAEESFKRIVSGEKLPRREPKIGYNGAQGVPIREEILSRHRDAVITRNAYGAHCLNTPDVLFADIDFSQTVGGRTILIYAIILLAGAIGLGAWLHSGAVALFAGFFALILAYFVAQFTQKILLKMRGGPESFARERIKTFVQRNPDWHLRLYRTPAGFRIMAMQAVFDPQDPKVADFFAVLGVDPVYATMCRNQHCFRARVSPKPWRIGISHHMRPRPGVWPVNESQKDVRNEWIRGYEAASTAFASCRFVESFGGSIVHPKAEAVRDLHDRLSQALSGRDIA
jgi:hypothetical protein